MRIVSGAAAAPRVGRAVDWLAGRRPDEPVLILAASAGAAAELARAAVAARGGAAFGWQRMTLGRLAATLAGPRLVAEGLAPVGPLSLEALCARVVHRLGEEGALGRFQAIADRPGLPRALVRAIGELRLAHVTAAELGDEELAHLQAAFAEELAAAGLADRARVLELAADAAAARAGEPLLLLDVPISSLAERDLVAALAARAPDFLATVPEGDSRTLGHLASLGAQVEHVSVSGGALARLQEYLFHEAARPPEAAPDDEVVLLSAPGENRECVEIARRIHGEAARGVPFDRMAVLLRAPAQYRAHLAEALGRAGVPAHFAEGTVLPDPAGRALLALLACAAEGLSASRFAEYLSLGEVPEVTAEGAPPPEPPSGDRWAPPDEELVRLAAPDGDDEEPPAGGPRAPHRWERLLVDAAVIGGRERWARRLAGLERELRLALAARAGDADERDELRLARSLEDLAALRAFALPLLDLLAARPARAEWGAWLDWLARLAARALRRPGRVLALLAELAPMASVGGVDLREVRLVLGKRLGELVVRPAERREGRVLVAPTGAARGLVFDVVFVPGLAEKLFPHKLTDDPILPERARDRLPGLERREDRVGSERLALRIAVGAARRRVVLSYPRLDLDQARPRVPSFYGLEVLRATEGRLPGFDELAARAEKVGAARVGWPAPARAEDAIDEAEHDLALLDDLFHRGEASERRRPVPQGRDPGGECSEPTWSEAGGASEPNSNDTVGRARYLLGVNPYLARALRFRARRWLARWTRADGLVVAEPAANAALAAHGLAARTFSATALQAFAACPYQFVLHTIHKLAPREAPRRIEEMDPLQRGSLVHEVQFELLSELREAGLLPVTSARLDDARARLDRVLDGVAARYRDDLHPAIDRVWEDGVAGVRADLREWLRRVAEDGAWTPWRFELSFGLPNDDVRRVRDVSSTAAPAVLDCGIRLRGSIDLVERNAGGGLRATDHKTGKVRVRRGEVIAGGRTLQPVLYALALEKLFPDARVEAGRLFYCTAAGGFEEYSIPLDDAARAAAQTLAEVVGGEIARGFLPAAPEAGACELCDYQPICGPYEELRTRRKRRDALVPLERLRRER